MIAKDLECVKCGRVETIQRKGGRDKAVGHIKHLWCVSCRKRTPHVELSEHKFEMEVGEDEPIEKTKVPEMGERARNT